VKNKSTYYYRIGKSNWYRRKDKSGNTVKVRLSNKEFNRRNKIIKSVRIYQEKRKEEKRKEEKKKIYPLDAAVFDIDRPEKTVLITIYDYDKKTIIDRADVRPENFYLFFRKFFNFYYEQAMNEELYYSIG